MNTKKKFIKKLKRKIVYLLGGTFNDDLPTDLQILIIKYRANKTIDNDLYNILKEK